MEENIKRILDSLFVIGMIMGLLAVAGANFLALSLAMAL